MFSMMMYGLDEVLLGAEFQIKRSSDDLVEAIGSVMLFFRTSLVRSFAVLVRVSFVTLTIYNCLHIEGYFLAHIGRLIICNS
jgi:hypothetical protein